MNKSTERERANSTGQGWRGVWPLGVLALLCLAFYWDVLWLPADRIVANNDLTRMFLRWLRFATSSIREGHLPLWNPYLHSGLPFVANPQPALFYPPTWLGLLMPATKALGLIIVLHVWLAGAGMYTWLRSEGALIGGALIGGAVYAFSGYVFVRVYAGHLGVITTGAWLPLLLWIYKNTLHQGSWKLAVIGGLPVGLSILAGHTATFLYVALGLAAYALFYAWRSWQEEQSAWGAILPLIRVGVMLLVGLALAAGQLLPMAELVARSTRQVAASYDFAARFSWPPGYLLTLLVPNFFGEPAHTGYWGDGIYDEFIFYVGVLPLLLALLGLRLRHRLKPFLFALGLGALLLAFGEYGILHRLFYRFVPLFKVARAPARAGFLFTLAASALAGLTVTALQKDPPDRRATLLRALRWPLVLTVVVATLVMIVGSFAAFAWGRDSNAGAGRLWHLANRMSLFLLFFLLAVGLLTRWRDRSDTRTSLWLLALGLAILDLWTFGGRLVNPVTVQESEFWREVAHTVENPQTARVLPWGLNDVQQNGGMAFDLRSVFGYDPLSLQRYEAFITSHPDPRARTYDLLNVRYLAAGTPPEFPSDDHLEDPKLLLEQPGVYVYERPTALPRAWVASQIEVMDEAAMLARIHEADFDPSTTALLEKPMACSGTDAPTTVDLVRDTGNRIEAQIHGGGGLLIFSEVDYPGWRATVDGNPVPLIRADYLLRALCVPEGQHDVTLTYDPPLLKIGLAITALTMASIIGAAIGIRRER